jgi:hypothetical protein
MRIGGPCQPALQTKSINTKTNSIMKRAIQFTTKKDKALAVALFVAVSR